MRKLHTWQSERGQVTGSSPSCDCSRGLSQKNTEAGSTAIESCHHAQVALDSLKAGLPVLESLNRQLTVQPRMNSRSSALCDHLLATNDASQYARNHHCHTLDKHNNKQ